MKRLLLFLLLAIPGACYGDSDLLWNYRIGSGVWTVDMSADSEYTAAGTFTSTASGYGHGIYLFDKSGNLLFEHETTDVVWSVSVSEDGGYIAAGSKDKNVYMLDMSGALLWKYEIDDTVWSVAISQDGEYIAAGSYDNHIYLFDNSGSLLWKYKTDDIVLSTSISQDGEYIAAGSYDNHIYLFDNSGSLLWKYRTNNVLFATSISSNGDYIAAGSYDNNVYLFDKFGNLLFEYETQDEVWDVAISSDGSHIAAASKDSNVYFLSSSGDLLGKYRTEGYVSSVAISADGDRAAAGSYDRSVSFFGITPLASVGEKAPKLEVTKSLSETTLERGKEITVFIELKNTGGTSAKLIEFSDEIPDGFNLVEGELSYMTDLAPGESKTFSYVIIYIDEINEPKKIELPKPHVSYIDIAGNQYTAESPSAFVTLTPRTSYIPVYTIRYRLGAIVVSFLDMFPGGAPISDLNDAGGKVGALLSFILKLAFVAIAALISFVLIRGVLAGRKSRRKVDKAEILMKIRKEVGTADPNLPPIVKSTKYTPREVQAPPPTRRKFRWLKFGKSTYRKEKIDLLKNLKGEVKNSSVGAQTDFGETKQKTNSALDRIFRLGDGKSKHRKEKIDLLKSLKKEVRK
jgi:uncharacterized repeat protein (TIGR01451 family)